MQEYPKASLDGLIRLLDELRPALQLSFQPAVDLIVRAFATGHKVLICGNGGSWCDAAHLAGELTVKYDMIRRALPAIALTDPCSLTACANDFGFEQVFARQVDALGNPGDVLVGISTSGASKNIREAILRAKFRGLGTLGLSGHKGFAAGPDVDIVVPSRTTARIQEAHALIIHMLCEAIEERLPHGEDPKWAQTS